jgi:ribosomal protein S27E
MGDFVTLTCPTCGARLQVTQDIDRFACGSCGNEHLIKRTGGVVALTPLVEGLKGVEKATDRTASEMAVRRLQREIDEDTKVLEALKDPQKDPACGSFMLGIAGSVFLCWVMGLLVEIQKPILFTLTMLPVLLFVVLFLVSRKQDREGHTKYLQARQDLTRRIEENQTELEWHRENLRRQIST